MRLSLSAALVVALSLSGAALAGAIFGTVKDENGKPLAGAGVQVYGKELSTKTGSDGSFRIESEDLLDGNKYSVTVTADGYDTAQTVSVEMFDDPDEMEPVEVELYKTEPLPVSTNDIGPSYLPEGLVSNQYVPADDESGEVDLIDADLLDTNLLDAPVEEPSTNAPRQ
jgi:hypothetical protein